MPFALPRPLVGGTFLEIEVRTQSDVKLINLRGRLNLGEPLDRLAATLTDLVNAGDSRLILQWHLPSGAFPDDDQTAWWLPEASQPHKICNPDPQTCPRPQSF